MSRKIEAIFTLKDQFTKNLTKIENKMMASTRKMGMMQSQIRKGAKVVQNVGTSMSKYVTAPIVGAGAASVKAASDFQTHFAKLTTIADTSKKTGVSVGTLQKQLRNLSDTTGQSQSALAEATYQAISAGRSTKQAVSFVGQAGKLAKGGVTDMTTATDTLTTIMNAYGKSAGSASSISDKLIETQNLGKTTVAELGSTMGKVVPTANMYKVSLDQLTSAYVTTTKNGINTAQSTTVINSMLTQLGKGSTSAAKALKAGTGHTFEELMKKGWSLTDAVKAVDKQSKKSGKTLGETFNNVNATKGAATLLQHTKDYDAALKGMSKSSGLASKSAATMANTTANQLKSLKTRIQNIAIEVGQTILPMLNPIMQKVESVITKISKTVQGMSTSTKKHIISVLGVAAMIGPVLVVVSKIGLGIANTVSIVNKFAKSMKVAGGFVKLLTSPLGITVIALTAVAVATVLVMTHWKQIKSAAQTIWKPISNVIKGVGTVFKGVANVFKSGATMISNVFKKCGVSVKGMAKTFAPVKSEAKKLGTAFKPIGTAIGTAINSAVKHLKTFISGVADVYKKIKPYIDLIIDMYKQVFKAKLVTLVAVAGNLFKVFANTVSTVASSVLKVFRGIIEFITGTFTGNWKKAWQGVKDIFKGIFSGFAAIAKAPINAVIGVINGAIQGINSIHVDIPSWVPGMGGKKLGFSIGTIPYLAKGTPKWKGGPAIINEKGGELVDLPSGTRVIPHDKSIQTLQNENNKLASIISALKNAFSTAKQPTTITNNVDASHKDYSSNKLSDLSRTIKNAIDRSYNLSNKFNSTRNNTNNAKQSYERVSNNTRNANRAYTSDLNKSAYNNSTSKIKSSKSFNNAHSVNNNKTANANAYASTNTRSQNTYDVFRRVINFDTSNVNTHRSNTSNSALTNARSDNNTYANSSRTILGGIKNALSSVKQSYSNAVNSFKTSNSAYTSDLNKKAYNNAYSSLKSTQYTNSRAYKNNSYASVSTLSAKTDNMRNIINHNAESVQNVSNSSLKGAQSAFKNSRTINNASLSKHSALNNVNNYDTSNSSHASYANSSMSLNKRYLAHNVLNMSKKNGVSAVNSLKNVHSMANSKYSMLKRINNYDTSNASSLSNETNKTSVLKQAVSPFTSVKNIASKIVGGATNALTRNAYTSTNKKSSAVTTNNSTSDTKYNSNSYKYLNGRSFTTANNTRNDKTSNDYHTNNDNRTINIIIQKLADKFEIDGKQDIDEIADELAKELKLAIANMD